VTSRGMFGAVLGGVGIALCGLSLGILSLGDVPAVMSPRQAYAQVSSCGNGILEPPEECDPPGSITCPPGSPAGAFLPCGPNCMCPVVVTTSTSSSTLTTTSISSSTSSTVIETFLHHFQCYEIRPPAPFDVAGVNLVDQFGSSTVELRKVYTLCAPADKNGEDPTAPAQPGHLTSYGIGAVAPFSRIRNITVTNQFGSLQFDVVKPARLMVPTAKSLAGPPASPVGSVVDHFQCYKVKRSRGVAKFQKVVGVSITTQFESATIDVVRPLRLCAPANKNGESPGTETHPDHLLCYRAKGSGALTATQVNLNNQFGQQTYLVSQRRELCVPSLKNAGPSTTTTTSTSTTPTSSTTTTSVPGICGNGVVDQPSEQCDGGDLGVCFSPLPAFPLACDAPGSAHECNCCFVSGCVLDPESPLPLCCAGAQCQDVTGIGMVHGGACIPPSCAETPECNGYECVGGTCCGQAGQLCGVVDCCPASGATCNAVPFIGAHVCCRPAGAPCAAYNECCSGLCNAGTCG